LGGYKSTDDHLAANHQSLVGRRWEVIFLGINRRDLNKVIYRKTSLTRPKGKGNASEPEENRRTYNEEGYVGHHETTNGKNENSQEATKSSDNNARKGLFPSNCNTGERGKISKKQFYH